MISSVHGNPRKFRKWSAGIAGVTLAALVLSAAPAAAAKARAPKKWAKSFCTTLIDFTDTMDDLNSEITDSAVEAETALAEDPSLVFDYIDGLAGNLADAADAAADTADDIRRLRRPAVGGGKEIKALLDDVLGGGLEQIGEEFESTEGEFRRIVDETTDPLVAAEELITAADQMIATFTELGNTLSESFESLDADPTLDPDDVLLRALERTPACAPIANG